MKELKMSDDNVFYCLQTISGFEPEDIECDDFEIAVNDDQFATMSIVKSAELGSGLIKKLTEENKRLREALIEIESLPEVRMDESSFIARKAIGFKQ